MKKNSRSKFASDVIADEVIENLEQQLSNELDDGEFTEQVPITEDEQVDVEGQIETAQRMIRQAEDDTLPEEQPVVGQDDVEEQIEIAQRMIRQAENDTLPDEKPIVSQDDVEEQIEIAQRMIRQAEDDTLPDEKPIVNQDDDLINACDELTAQIEASWEEEPCKKCGEIPCKCASEFGSGIEDEIGDEAHGGDSSVSDIVDTKIDCSTDSQVFPTNSEYVASITKRLDRVATALQKKGMRRMAFRIDQLSDKIESSIR